MFVIHILYRHTLFFMTTCARIPPGLSAHKKLCYRRPNHLKHTHSHLFSEAKQ